MPRFEKRPVKEWRSGQPNSVSDKDGGAAYRQYPISRPEGHGGDGKGSPAGNGDINKKGPKF